MAALTDRVIQRWNGLSWDTITFAVQSHTHDSTSIITGVLGVDRIPSLAISKITNLQSSLDGKLYYNDVMMPTNPFGGKKLYLNHTDNAMFAMNKKGNVVVTRHLVSYGGNTYPKLNPDYFSSYAFTGSGTTRQITTTPYPATIVVYENDVLKISPTNYSYNNASGLITFTYTPSGTIYIYPGAEVPQYLDSPIDATLSSEASLFDGSYESNINVANGYYLKIKITPDGTNYGSFDAITGSYKYGSFYVSYYYTGTPTETYYRVYNYSYRPHTPGWKLQTLTDYVGTKTSSNYIATTSDEGNHGRTIIEFIVIGHDTAGGAYITSISQIDWKLSRPNLSVSGSTVTKFGLNKLYYSLKFGDRLNDNVIIDPVGSISIKNIPVIAVNNGTGLLKNNGSGVWSYDNATYITGITKAMVEAVLTGSISTHSHAYDNYVSWNLSIGDDLTYNSDYTVLKGYDPKLNFVNGLKASSPSGGAGYVVYQIEPNYGNAANTICQGNDSRLSNDRTPLTHGNEKHSVTYITGITKAMVEAVLTGAITSHTHSYLPLAGGIMVGDITIQDNKLKYDDYSYIQQTGQLVDIYVDNAHIVQFRGDGYHDMKTRRLVNVVDPTAAQDAATKNYVDSKYSETSLGTITTSGGQISVSNFSTDYKYFKIMVKCVYNTSYTTYVMLDFRPEVITYAGGGTYTGYKVIVPIYGNSNISSTSYQKVITFYQTTSGEISAYWTTGTTYGDITEIKFIGVKC